MAEIYPFRALHYNPELTPELSKVVTQPYDKISPEMRVRYYELSPYNLVRIIRGRENPGDSAGDNVYTRAARDLHEWVERRILIAEREPALYAYSQEHTLPGPSGEKRRRQGLIALCRLEDYSRGVVFRHEETLSGPKADRLELLKATRAHFGQIFMLYSDPEGRVEKMLASAWNARPWERAVDEYGTAHSVHRIADPSDIERIAEAMRAKKLVIADGHHRYETALAYRDYCRAQGQHDDRAEYVMITLVRAESPGLSVLPTHRVVHGLSGFDWSRFGADAQRFVDWEPFLPPDPGKGLRERFFKSLISAGHERPTIGAYGGPGKWALLRLRQGADSEALWADLPPTLRRLDVVVLHRLILEGVLGIDRQAVQREQNLRYVREFDAAIEQVDTGKAQVCFLMNPTPVRAVLENALAGHVLPQKSTDFYPKLLSGLTGYWLDHPGGM